MRPIVIAPNNREFFAVNTYDSTVEHFVGGSPDPVDIFPVPWGPVSIAWWEDPTGNEQLLVVCRGSHVLVHLDPRSGHVLRLVDLPSEPGDILVDDAADRAFVSCSGADSVVQLSLVGNGRITYSQASHPAFRCKNPLFLSFDSQRRVLVAPMISGNDSTAELDFARRAGDLVPDLFQTMPFVSESLEEHVVSRLGWVNFDDTSVGHALTARVNATVAYKQGGPPAVPAAGRLVVARLIVDGQVSDSFTADGISTFKADQVALVDLDPQNDMLLGNQGPFLLTRKSDLDGLAVFAFQATGLASLQLVTLNIDAVITVDEQRLAELHQNLADANACSNGGGTFDGDCDGDAFADCCRVDIPVLFARRTLSEWSFPDTPKQARALTSTFGAHNP